MNCASGKVERTSSDDAVLRKLKIGVIEVFVAREFLMVRGATNRSEVHVDNAFMELPLWAAADQEVSIGRCTSGLKSTAPTGTRASIRP